jgi:imidazolonepropionase-like amidohydrolase
MIPGLIDSHLHLTDVQSLENFTSYGCTTAMHMNCENYTQCHINANQVGLASFQWAGRSAVGNGSHHAQTDPSRPRDTLIYPDTDVVQWKSYQFDNGSDYTKITAEVNGPSNDQQIQMVNTAHLRYNKQSTTHASAIMSYDQAVVSNTVGIQHVPDDGILSDETIQKILEQGQSVTPTVNVFEFAYRDPVLLQYFAVQAGSNRSLSHAEHNAKLLYQMGVPLLAGTDPVGTLAKDGKSVQVPWGLTLHFELQNLVNIDGMSPAEALNAATRDAAK